MIHHHGLRLGRDLFRSEVYPSLFCDLCLGRGHGLVGPDLDLCPEAYLYGDPGPGPDLDPYRFGILYHGFLAAVFYARQTDTLDRHLYDVYHSLDCCAVEEAHHRYRRREALAADAAHRSHEQSRASCPCGAAAVVARRCVDIDQYEHVLVVASHRRHHRLAVASGEIGFH